MCCSAHRDNINDMLLKSSSDYRTEDINDDDDDDDCMKSISL